MSGRPNVPEDAFRVEGHCCAATLPGIRDGDTPVDWGIGRNPKDANTADEIAGSRPEGRPD